MTLHQSKFNEAGRIELAKLYRRIGERFGYDRLLARMRQGWIVRAAHARVEQGKKEST